MTTEDPRGVWLHRAAAPPPPAEPSGSRAAGGRRPTCPPRPGASLTSPPTPSLSGFPLPPVLTSLCWAANSDTGTGARCATESVQEEEEEEDEEEEEVQEEEEVSGRLSETLMSVLRPPSGASTPHSPSRTVRQ
ncbi:hypothetical protein INR49_006747 [Caranx melampygus]|nr:hypothetical protein INR49_006747 [Caranx melampygus]